MKPPPGQTYVSSRFRATQKQRRFAKGGIIRHKDAVWVGRGDPEWVVPSSVTWSSATWTVGRHSPSSPTG